MISPVAYLKKNTVISISLALIAGALFLFFLSRHSSSGIQYAGVTRYAELEELKGKNLDFKSLSVFFTSLAEKKGAEYAFEVLKIAEVPPNTDMHLLGHVVGDVLYKQKGLEGITICTNDFRNACSHSIVVGLLLEKGESALPEIAQACRRAPGGGGAYTMCYHGLGHGILSYVGYDLPKSVGLCKKTGTAAYHQDEYIQCVGGTIMEIISGGGHNQELWAKKRVEYLRPDDPLYPCAASFMPDEAKAMCYNYLTPYLWVAAGGNIGNPTADIFTKSFKFCDLLPVSDMRDRGSCFGGFGKEFIALVRNRDIRNVESMTDGQLTQMYEWCLLAPNKDGRAACVVSAVGSLYWGGENDRSVAIRFCGTAKDPYLGESCYMNLMGQAAVFTRTLNERQAFCNDLPQQYFERCKQILIK